MICFSLSNSLVRLYNAIFIEKKGWHYIIYGRGWIDFLASVPLLMLSSGPALLTLLLNTAGFIRLGNILNLLKIIKAIRIARVLRLLRILKIFKNIKYANSSMAQRHVSKLTTICVMLIIIAAFCYAPLQDWVSSLNKNVFANSQEAQLINFLNTNGTINKSEIQSLTGLRDDILLIRKNDKVLYSRYDKEFYKKELTMHDYTLLSTTGQQGNWQVFIDMRNRNKADELLHSGQSLFFFALILVLVLVYLVIYSPHFAITVSDPVNIMIRGFEKADYNLTVKIPELYTTDEVFNLARLYNEIYLPLKARQENKNDPASLKLQLDDIKDILH